MLSRKQRISRTEFPSRTRQGIRVFSESATGTLYQGSLTTKVSIVVSKKIAPRAVDRNALKRRFYDATQPLLKTLTQPLVIVLYPKKEVLGMSLQKTHQEIKSLLHSKGFIS